MPWARQEAYEARQRLHRDELEGQVAFYEAVVACLVGEISFEELEFQMDVLGLDPADPDFRPLWRALRKARS